MTRAVVTHHIDRTWGLHRHIWTITCRPCRWRTQVHYQALAEQLRRLHECQETT